MSEDRRELVFFYLKASITVHNSQQFRDSHNKSQIFTALAKYSKCVIIEMEVVVMNTLTAREAARVILTYGSMEHKKLQKIMYFFDGLQLAVSGKPFLNADFEAWVHGPVCREVYAAYGSYRMYEMIPETSASDRDLLTETQRKFFDVFYQVYGGYNADELEAISHNTTPWMNKRIGLEPWEASTTRIDKREMLQYFSELLERNQVE